MSTALRTGTIGLVSLAALTGAFAAGSRFGQPDAGSLNAAGRGPVLSGANSAVSGALDSGKSCDELLEWYRAEGLKLVGPYGWGGMYGGPVMLRELGDRSVADTGTAAGESAGSMGAVPRMNAATSSATGTNVQEAGVDEPDQVKTNGEILVRIQGDRLKTYDVSNGDPELLNALRVSDIAEASLLLAGDDVVVLGRDDATANQTARTRMTRLDITDPTSPQVMDTQVFSSALVGATQHGDTVRLVMSQGLPELDFSQPRRWRNESSALERNQELVRESTLEDWLPSVTRSGEPSQPLLACADVAVPDDDSGLGTLAIVGFDVGQPERWSTAGVATDSSTAYTSQDRLYVATRAGGWWGGWGGRGLECCWGDGPGADAMPQFAPDGVTRIHAFALAGTAASYLASGEVEGQIADRWSMDESDGVLRVAVGATNATGNFNSVVTLAVHNDVLVEVGRLDKLGVDEQIMAMRWFDSMAVMVTFRQIDPLYAIDLTDASAPRLLGKLKIPGFSDYLHPVGPERMIGLGVDITRSGSSRGAQAGLFNLADVTNPRRVATVGYGPETEALAGVDPRQFTWLPERRTALTVVARGYGSRTGFVSVLELVDGRFVTRLVEVEYGDEVADVRLVPLTSGPAAGEVVLVTGDDVRRFPL